MADGHLILAAGALLAGGLIASFVAMRLRVPSLVLFLGVGMLVGSDALGWITLDSYRLARTVGVISLVLILFEGGLTTEFVHLRPVLAAASSLATVGTAITAAVTGLSAACAVRVLDQGRAAAGRRSFIDGRGRDLRAVTRLVAVAEAGADARGRVRPE